MKYITQTPYYDVYGKEIFVGMTCIDIIERVEDIKIIESDNEFFALPQGLDPEPLSKVAKNLMIIK